MKWGLRRSWFKLSCHLGSTPGSRTRQLLSSPGILPEISQALEAYKDAPDQIIDDHSALSLSRTRVRRTIDVANFVPAQAAPCIQYLLSDCTSTTQNHCPKKRSVGIVSILNACYSSNMSITSCGMTSTPSALIALTGTACGFLFHACLRLLG